MYIFYSFKILNFFPENLGDKFHSFKRNFDIFFFELIKKTSFNTQSHQIEIVTIFMLALFDLQQIYFEIKEVLNIERLCYK
jgi:hypothetical protein